MKSKGFIQIYTGDGKGKTTAAVGLACRAHGHDMRVCYIYFYKNPGKKGYGEHRILKKLGIEVIGFAEKHPYFFKNISKKLVREESLKGIKFIKNLFKDNKYDILIIDELVISIKAGYLTEEEIIDILNSKPVELELILTGRGITKKIIEHADLVSEIKKIKHPYDSRIKARKGIEY